jgi:AraC family transcriptional regulator
VLPETPDDVDAGPIHLIHVAPPAGTVVDPALPEYALHLMLRPPPLLQVGFNRPPRWLALSPGALLAAPPDTAAEFVADHPAELLSVAIPKARAEAFLAEAGRRIEIRREEIFHDRRVAARLVRLWHAIAEDEPAGRLLADMVMRDILGTLAGRSGGRPGARESRERLPAHVVRRIRDFVESSLADDLDVPALAAVAGLSDAHFARAFAATVGVAPYHYVMRRRLARARALIERTRRSTHAIALEVGFTSPSHFTARFRREFGVVPSALRADGEMRSFRTA